MALSQQVKDLILSLFGGDPDYQSQVVTSLNKARTLVAGTNVTLNDDGSNVTINASSGSSFEFYAGPACTSLSSAVTSSSFTTFSNSPTLTFTAGATGKYKVYSGASIIQNGAGNSGYAQIACTSGSPTVVATSSGLVFGSADVNVGGTMFIQSVFTLTKGQTYSFDIQGATSAGNVYLQAQNISVNIFAERVS